MDLVEQDRRALEEAARLAGLVAPGQLENATPCAQWTLGDLLRHMIAQNHGFAVAARDGRAPDSLWSGSALDGEPAEAFAASARQVTSAFSAPGALAGTVELPDLGEFPAATAVGFHFVDNLIHAWDVARAIGADAALPEDLVLAAAQVASGWPDSPGARGPGKPFGPRVAVPRGAPLLDQLLGGLGRSPAWLPPGGPAGLTQSRER